MTRSSSTAGRTIALTALAAIVVWALYLARQVLLLIYISMVLAIGFAPLVHAIEHQRVIPVGTRRLPRWLVILVVYLTIVEALTFVGLLVVPPLIDQSQELWNRAPRLFESTQKFLLSHGLLNHPITLEEAVRAGPAPGNAVGTVATAVTTIVGGLFGFVTILILTFYLLTESESLSAGFARLFPRVDRPHVAILQVLLQEILDERDRLEERAHAIHE